MIHIMVILDTRVSLKMIHIMGKVLYISMTEQLVIMVNLRKVHITERDAYMMRQGILFMKGSLKMAI